MNSNGYTAKSRLFKPDTVPSHAPNANMANDEDPPIPFAAIPEDHTDAAAFLDVNGFWVLRVWGRRGLVFYIPEWQRLQVSNWIEGHARPGDITLRDSENYALISLNPERILRWGYVVDEDVNHGGIFSLALEAQGGLEGEAVFKHNCTRQQSLELTRQLMPNA